MFQKRNLSKPVWEGEAQVAFMGASSLPRSDGTASITAGLSSSIVDHTFSARRGTETTDEDTKLYLNHDLTYITFLVHHHQALRVMNRDKPCSFGNFTLIIFFYIAGRFSTKKSKQKCSQNRSVNCYKTSCKN